MSAHAHGDKDEEDDEEQYTEDMEEGDRVQSSVIDFENAGFCNSQESANDAESSYRSFVDKKLLSRLTAREK